MSSLMSGMVSLRDSALPLLVTAMSLPSERAALPALVQRSMEENELLAFRRQKLRKLIEQNMNPFGGRFDVSGTIGEVRQGFIEGQRVRLAGRITAHRNMGKSQFLDLSD